MNKKITVLGGGSFGTSIAVLLDGKGHEVTLWMRNKDDCELLRNQRKNKYLKDLLVSESIIVENDISKSIKDSEIIVLAIPTHGIRENLEKVEENIKNNQVIVNLAKGIENETLMRVSEIVKEILPENKYAVLSGPSHAEEVALKKPTAVIVASEDKEVSKLIQDVFMTENFRVYTNSDVIGVELGGSIKNVIALGAGILDGLELGDNSKAGLMNRGIFEIARLGEAMGGKISTFFGLSGMGDLIVTCTSLHSRNRRAGILLGKGYTTDDAIKEVGMVVEGIKTTKSAYELSKKYNVSMPITEEAYKVIYEDKDPKESVDKLMRRGKKHEMENLILDEADLYK